MARLIFLFLLLPVFAQAGLQGVWQYNGYRYRGVERPPTADDLTLRYEFNSDGTSRLFWSYSELNEFCERRASYDVSENLITEVVTWINPNNSGSCWRDPDMQVGSQTSLVYRLYDKILEMDAYLGEEIVTYIWNLKP